MWTNDPVADYSRYDADCSNWIERRPMCCKCDEHIQSDYCYEIDGEYFDEECLDMLCLDKAPMGIKCCDCKKHIQDAETDDVFAYHIEGEWICEECMENEHRKWVEDVCE